MPSRSVRAAVVALPVIALAGCSVFAPFTQPEGGGGWSQARRESELGRLATAAEVPFTEAAASAPAPTLVASDAPLDLAGALALAATRNRRIAETQEQLAESRERVFEARGRLLPTTVGSGRYAWYTDARVTSVQLPAGTLPPGVNPIVAVQEQEFGTLNGTVSLPVDLSGEIRFALLAAQAGYRGDAARAFAVRLDQEVAVTRAFFGLLEAQRLREVVLQTQAANRAQLANAQRRYDEGRLTKNELLVVQVVLRNVDQELLQRDLAIAKWRWALNDSVGLPVDAPTQIVDVRAPPDVPSPEEAMRVGFESNPVLIALVEEQQRLEATLSSLERGWLPRFEVGGQLGRDQLASGGSPGLRRGLRRLPLGPRHGHAAARAHRAGTSRRAAQSHRARERAA